MQFQNSLLMRLIKYSYSQKKYLHLKSVSSFNVSIFHFNLKTILVKTISKTDNECIITIILVSENAMDKKTNVTKLPKN